MSLAARLLLAPYLAGAFVNSRSWTRHEPKPVAIGDGVWLGRIPLAREAAGFATVVDLCAELPGAATRRNLDVHPDARPRRRRSRRNCGTPRRASSAGARAGRCWSAARSATREAPPRSRPGCSRATPRENDERSDREGPSGAASHRHRHGAARPRSRPPRSDAHDRRRRETLLFCAAALLDQGPNRRSPVAPAHRGRVDRHPGLSGDYRTAADGARRSRDRSSRSRASPRRTSPSASASTRHCSIGLASAPEAPDFAGDRRRAHAAWPAAGDKA